MPPPNELPLWPVVGMFVWSAVNGRLPLAFGRTLLTNDLIWWPAFGWFVPEAARASGGW